MVHLWEIKGINEEEKRAKFTVFKFQDREASTPANQFAHQVGFVALELREKYPNEPDGQKITRFARERIRQRWIIQEIWDDDWTLAGEPPTDAKWKHEIPMSEYLSKIDAEYSKELANMSRSEEEHKWTQPTLFEEEKEKEKEKEDEDEDEDDLNYGITPAQQAFADRQGEKAKRRLERKLKFRRALEAAKRREQDDPDREHSSPPRPKKQ